MKRGSFGRGGAAAQGRAAPQARAKALPVRRSSAEADRVLRGLPTLWTPREWALLPQVRSHLGAGVEGLRVADVLAVELGGDERRIYVEIKVSRGDFVAEILEPGKSDEIGRYCHARVFAVPCPWDRIALSVGELPEGWGLVEVDGGRARMVEPPHYNEAEDAPPGLWLSMLRSSLGSDEQGPPLEYMRAINRPRLGPGVCGLACGHVAMAPLLKTWPFALFCEPCSLGWPVDLEVVRAVIDEATPEVRRSLRAQLELRGGGSGR